MKKKIEVKVYVTSANYRRYHSRYGKNHLVAAVVPAKIKDLLIEQARVEGLNMSAMIGQVLVNYLLDQGTKIGA